MTVCSRGGGRCDVDIVDCLGIQLGAKLAECIGYVKANLVAWELPWGVKLCNAAPEGEHALASAYFICVL